VIKFAAAAEAFTQLKRSFPPETGHEEKPAKLVSAYYDTGKRSDVGHGMGL
jgi:inorganic triphosphatase YgiF